MLLGVGSQSFGIRITQAFTLRIQNKGHEQPEMRSQKHKSQPKSLVYKVEYNHICTCAYMSNKGIQLNLVQLI